MVWQYVIPILVGLALYTFLGTLFDAWGTVIYHDLPANNFTVNYPGDISTQFTIQNNAPFTFPLITPGYFGKVEVIESSEKIPCYIHTSRGQVECDKTRLDVGYVAPGASKQISYTIRTNGNNFTVKLGAQLNFLFFSFDSPNSETITCRVVSSYSTSHTYFCD